MAVITTCVISVAGLVLQASGNLVEVDILELSRFPCRGVGIWAHQHRIDRLVPIFGRFYIYIFFF